MKKEIIEVPAGIKYMSDWKNFRLPENPSIINKQITGCGFTEYCITSSDNIILCSPRKILLENKENQHPEVLYVRNDLEVSVCIDKDISQVGIIKGEPAVKDPFEKLEAMKNQIRQYILFRTIKRQPVKIIVTYDSFRHVRDAVTNIEDFYIVIDEFQSIFIDSKFKSNTELEFLNYLKDLSRVCFVSATPMMDKYLGMLDEFKDLPYYEFDWEKKEPGRMTLPLIDPFPCRSIVQEALGIIESYQKGKFEKYTYPDRTVVESKECVLYVNSVKNICDLIRRSGLKLEEVNILCSRTPENEKKLRTLFKLKKDQSAIGKVPLRGEPRKMFTFCTRTVYLGADFYSPCARTFIFSDANIECLAVDITLDLPQILGRQRMEENPWRDCASLYFRSTRSTETWNQFMEKVNLKVERTKSLLKSYEEVSDKHTLAEAYQYIAQTANYRDNYVAVNRHGGNDIFPVFNNLVMVSEMRSFEIQQIDYHDRFAVLRAMGDRCNIGRSSLLLNAIKTWDGLGTFVDRMKFLCNVHLDFETWEKFKIHVPGEYKDYLEILGKARIKALSYQKSKLEDEIQRRKAGGDSLGKIIREVFVVGERYSRAWIKLKLSEVYAENFYRSTPKASDLEKWFEVKPVNFINSETGQKENGYRILSVK